jgi:hypothetical protein
VREAAQYIPGVGAAEGAWILRKGVSGLKPEEADAVMRAFKKQGLGLGLVSLGFFNPQAFGGYYTKGERDEKDLKPGELKIFGVTVPHLLSHSPAIEAIQFGATVRRVLDSQKSAGKESDAVEATYQAGKGLAEETPFVDSYLNAGRTFESTKSVSRAAGEFAKGAIIPPDVQRAARYFDRDAQGQEIKRYPQGGRLQRFAQSIETGIPGLRRNVPATKPELNRRTSPSIAVPVPKPPDPAKELKREMKMSSRLNLSGERESANVEDARPDITAEVSKAGASPVTEAEARGIARTVDSLEDHQGEKFLAHLDETRAMGVVGETASRVAEWVASGLGNPKAETVVRAQRILSRERRLRPAQYKRDALSGRYGEVIRDEVEGGYQYPQNRLPSPGVRP